MGERFGIPYATAVVKDGVLIRICPECGEEFPEDTDRYGETLTNNYGKHYAKNHEED